MGVKVNHGVERFHHAGCQHVLPGQFTDLPVDLVQGADKGGCDPEHNQGTKGHHNGGCFLAAHFFRHCSTPFSCIYGAVLKDVAGWWC